MRTILMTVALAACVQHTKFEPTTVDAPADAFARATRALTEQGESIETKDESAGLIVTKWEEEKDGGGLRKRLRWNITISSGRARIDSQCQMRMESSTPGVSTEWDDCGNQPESRGQKARAIADSISR